MSAQNTKHLCPVCKRSFAPQFGSKAEEGDLCALCEMDEEDQLLEDREMGDS